MGVLLKFFHWVFEKFAAGLLIVALGLVACATWYFLHDNVDFDVWRSDTLRSLNAERIKTNVALADVRQRMDRISAEISAEQEKARQSDKVIGELRELESTWDKMFGDRAQQQANQQRLEEVSKLRATATARLAALQTEFTRTTWERDGLEIEVGKLAARLREVEARQSRVAHYLELAWNRTRWWWAGAFALCLVGPAVGKLALYFWVAPVMTAGRPVRFRQDLQKFPEVDASGVSADLVLAPGERLWVKGKFLQASDERLRRKTRQLLDWRIPFTCFATGLVKLVEMSHRDESGEYRVTVSNRSDLHCELAVMSLAPGSAIVVRPTFLAGVTMEKGRRLTIRRRWQFFRWQSWVTLQFRFFEFVGPCRLVIAGSRGVQVERLAERDDKIRPAQRVSQEATIGFTPNLDYRPTRAATFWSYYSGVAPLFDDLFSGRGIFLRQQIPAEGGVRQARKFWPGVWGRVLKVFGV